MKRGEVALALASALSLTGCLHEEQSVRVTTTPTSNTPVALQPFSLVRWSSTELEVVLVSMCATDRQSTEVTTDVTTTSHSWLSLLLLPLVAVAPPYGAGIVAGGVGIAHFSTGERASVAEREELHDPTLPVPCGEVPLRDVTIELLTDGGLVYVRTDANGKARVDPPIDAMPRAALRGVLMTVIPARPK